MFAPQSTAGADKSRTIPAAGAGKGLAIQRKLEIGAVNDPLEHEADRVADKVMRMPAAPFAQRKCADCEKGDKRVQRKPLASQITPYIRRKSSDVNSSLSSSNSSRIESPSAGQPLSSDVRGYMEPRFNADFSNVRVHSDQESASLSNQLSARAFTYQNNIFFSRDQYQPGSSEGKRLLAHELTHTIQQGHAVQRSPQLSTSTTPPLIQRDGLGLDPAEYIADKARLIPGFTMLTVVIGLNPITGARVDRSAGNILKGAIEMIPVVGSAITDALNNHGVFSTVSNWAVTQFNTIKSIGSTIWQDIKGFIKNLSGKDLFSPGDAWERGKAIITNPIAQIKAFAIGLKEGIVTFIKDAILKPIAAFAKVNVPNGYDLLCAVLGKDPISDEPVPQTPENLIAPFMKMIGQEEVWENMKQSDAIGRSWAWFQKALGTVKGFVQELPAMFKKAFNALEVIDIVLIPRAFSKLVGVFGGFADRFIRWAGTAVWNLLEIIFDAVSPGALGYIKKTGSAIKSIFQNPLPFVGNLVKAAKQGFLNFADNIGGHLKAGLIDWLTGSLSGVYIPKALNLAELGQFALSILGITWAQIRGKIVKVLGPNGEKIMKELETGFDIVVALVKGGPAAAWELIKEKLTDLKDTVISGIIGFVTDTVVKKAIPKLIAMFIPGAGFISAIMSIYDTVMVFKEKISKIIQVATAFIDSIVTIAEGNITFAANRVESILGGLLSLAISFLAGFLGLGKITDKIKEVIGKVRLTVDKAIDAVIGWIVGKAKLLFGKLFGKGDKSDERTEEGKNRDKLAAIGEAEKLLSEKDFDDDVIRQKLIPITKRYKLLTLDLVIDSKAEESETVHFTASASSVVPGKPKTVKIGKKTELTLKPGEINGHSVGLGMKVDWLGSKHKQGSPPQGGVQSELMKLLVTNPSKRSKDKYIRGHLLNEHLGGEGKADNMFPITGYANSQHLHSTESTVKKWIKEKPKLWVMYEVKVEGISSQLKENYKSSNYVDSTFACYGELKNAAGEVKDKFSTKIESKFHNKQKAEILEQAEIRIKANKK